MKKYISLHDRLRGPVAEALKKELKVTNVHALPRIEKVVVNVGINRAKMESKEAQEYVGQCLARITGQKAIYTRSRKAISNFKIREGLIVGAVVTLHGRRMEEFLDRLLSYALPRIRDFRGVTTKLDGHGNYAIGLSDHSIFPEVPPADAGKSFGVQIQFTTTAKTDEPARALLKLIGIPFRPAAPSKRPASAKASSSAKATEDKSAGKPSSSEKPSASKSEVRSPPSALKGPQALNGKSESLPPTP